MRRKLLALVALLLVTTGCVHIQGQVTAKTYKEGYYQPMVQSYPCGKSTCTRIYQQYYPPCYGVEIDDKNSYCIERSDWEALEVGDYYDNELQEGT